MDDGVPHEWQSAKYYRAAMVAAQRERNEARDLVEEFRLIYAQAVGRDDVTDMEALGHLENVIFNARADTKVAEYERDASRQKLDEERRAAEKWHHKATVLAKELDLARERFRVLREAVATELFVAERDRDDLLFYVQENRTARELGKADAYRVVAKRLRTILDRLEGTT